MKNKLIILFIVIGFIGFVGLGDSYAGKAITIHVKVMPTKSNGKSWDPWGGAPDIKIKIYHEDLGTLSSPRIENTYETTVSFDIGNIEGNLQIEIWDMDMTDHDLIGRGEIHYATKGEYKIGRAKVYVR